MSELSYNNPNRDLGLQEIDDFLNLPENITNVHRLSAKVLTREIAKTLYESEVPMAIQETSTSNFEELYDPKLPTLAIEPRRSFQGAELLAMTGHETDINVLLLSTGVPCLETRTFEDGSSKLIATSGMLVSECGEISYGEFPRPIAIDLIDSSDKNIQEICEKLDIKNIAQKSDEQIASKLKIADILEDCDILTPRRFDDIDAVETSDFIIKPANGVQGIGVNFYNQSNKEAANKYYDFLNENGYSPIIEEQISCFPIFDPESGKRVDWNVRAIIANGQFIDMYARIGKHGSAINKSQGAKPFTIENMSQYSLDKDQLELIELRLIEAIAEVSDNIDIKGVVGLDITLDEAMRPVIFEINTGYVGGIRTIAKIQSNPVEKLEDAHAIIQAWHPLFQEKLQKRELVDSTIIVPDFDSKMDAIYLCNISPLVSKIPGEDLIEYMQKIDSILNWVELNSHSSSNQKQAYNFLIDNFPVEALRKIPDMITELAFSDSGSHKLINFLNRMESSYPRPEEWKLLKAWAYAENMQLLKMRQEVTSLIKLDVDQNQLNQKLSLMSAAILSTVLEIEDAMQEKFIEIIRSFCLAGNELTQNVLKILIENSDSSMDKNTYSFLSYIFNVAEGKYEAASEYIEILARDGATDPIAIHEA